MGCTSPYAPFYSCLRWGVTTLVLTGGCWLYHSVIPSWWEHHMPLLVGPCLNLLPQEIHWCVSQHRPCTSVLLSSLLVFVCRRKYLTEVFPISELAPYHSTDIAHPQHKAAPQLLVSSSTPFARAGEMEKKWSRYAKLQAVPRVQQEGRIWEAKISLPTM